jgi:thiamine transport system permease protein
MEKWRASGVAIPLGVVLAAGLFLVAFLGVGALLSIGSNNASAIDVGELTRIAGFTFWQASLSAILSLVVALPVARSSWRRASAWSFNKLILLSFMAFVMPTTVAVTGLLGIWGQNGVMSQLLQQLGFARLPPIFGLGAVLLAHVFFNAPLMLRVLTTALASIPQSHWRLAAQWELSNWDRFRAVEWPMLGRVIPGLLAIVFLICFTSFSLILMLGGGPGVTTLEVSIYTALRFEFDLPKAAILSLLQLLICASVVAIMARVSGPSWAGAPTSISRSIAQPEYAKLHVKLFDAVVLAGFLLLTVAPLISLVWRGIGPHFIAVLGWPSLHRALVASLVVALLSSFIATVLALIMASARIRLGVRAKWIMDSAVSLYLAVSAIVLGTGAFILLRGFVDVFALAPILVITANALVALPFAYRVVEGRMAVLAKRHDKLCAGLNIRGWRRFRRVTLPAMAPELGVAAGLSAALSLGDLTVIALFGSQQFQTLPWLLYQTMGRYRSEDAAALALVLLIVTLVLFLAFSRLAKLLQRRRFYAAH